jgi:hypothetical protein
MWKFFVGIALLGLAIVALSNEFPLVGQLLFGD